MAIPFISLRPLMTIVILFLLASTVQSQPAQPNTFLIDRAFLKNSKDRIAKGDAELIKAKTALVKAADEACNKGPYSVTNKEKLPPSGDKHDYMSVGPYWWPDTTKPDGLPYIRRDGQTNPERHKVKDADDAKALGHDVKLLGIAFYFTGEKKYAAHAAKLLRVWFLDAATKMNPHLKYGQAIPGITEGRGIGLIDTKCFVDIIDGVQLIEGSAAWPESDHKALQQWFSDFLQWAQSSDLGKDEADEHNNHGTYYDLQMATIALFTGNEKLAKDILQNQTLPRIESQLAADGSQPHELARTRSANYCMMNLKGFFALAILGDRVGVDLWNYETPTGKSLKEAFLWMVPYASGEKKWTHEQIDAFEWDTFLSLVNLAALHYKDLDLTALQKKLSAQAGHPYISVLSNSVWY
ncbi:alginate lyase family protein [Fulvivirgaceae bacterium PWU4]|uniref:Alginate lyase family protein n=1 Tax=Chryseosolibacter histidini TaxID=2782349 RepID=A0AAP2GPI0_9BACT|nr:alginate lyase family protein [Chryseosolibacter histidini]MBT1697462.1 alginate lyase family protein [Chryseosolibacter histidini]